MATLKLTSTDEQEKAEDKQEQMNPPNPIAENVTSKLRPVRFAQVAS